MLSDNTPTPWFLRSGAPTVVTALLRITADPAAVRLDIAALLHGLGSTTAQVAATLTAAGVNGTPGDAVKCPVSDFLLTHVRPMSDVVVGTDVSGMDWGDDTIVIVVPVPAAVDAFLTAFDAGTWPHMIAAPLPDIACLAR